MPRLAGELLCSSLVGLEALFERVGIDLWRGAARRLLDLHDPEAMAAGYQRMSQGSAPGTFYDLIISCINGHAVTEAQEPWVNQLLTTFQAVAAVASRAIAGEGPSAGMPVPSRGRRAALPMAPGWGGGPRSCPGDRLLGRLHHVRYPVPARHGGGRGRRASVVVGHRAAGDRGRPVVRPRGGRPGPG